MEIIKNFNETKLDRKACESIENDFLEKTEEIRMPSRLNKNEIAELMPFNMQGNKAHLLADSIGGAVVAAAGKSERVIDAFGGAGTYIHYLRSCGNDKPMMLNEYDPFRYITHNQLKQNPISVTYALQDYVEKLEGMVGHLDDEAPFDEKAAKAQGAVVDFLQKEADRLVFPWQDFGHLSKNGLPVNMISRPELAALYILIQCQKRMYRPVQADADPDGLKPVMNSSESETVANKDNRVKLFYHGKKYIFNARERIKAISQRLNGVEITNEDGWKLIQNNAGDGDFVLVDTSYLGKATNNYNVSTQEDSAPDIYLDKIKQYLVPALRRGARFLITNNWNDDVVRELKALGFSVYKAFRKYGDPELVAMNFDKETGCIASDPRPKSSNFLRVHFSSATVEWPTPQGVFDELNAEFGFTLDPCATHKNAKCERYFTMDDDGLKQDWGKETVFMNPPYGRAIKDWMKKAYQSSLEGATVVCLPPARTDTQWWHDYAMKGEIRLIRGRLKFGGAKTSAPFPSAIVIFRPPEDVEMAMAA